MAKFFNEIADDNEGYNNHNSFFNQSYEDEDDEPSNFVSVSGTQEEMESANPFSAHYYENADGFVDAAVNKDDVNSFNTSFNNEDQYNNMSDEDYSNNDQEYEEQYDDMNDNYSNNNQEYEEQYNNSFNDNIETLDEVDNDDNLVPFNNEEYNNEEENDFIEDNYNSYDQEDNSNYEEEQLRPFNDDEANMEQMNYENDELSNNEMLEDNSEEEQYRFGDREFESEEDDELKNMFVPVSNEVEKEERDLEIENPVAEVEEKYNDREVSGNPVACFWLLIEVFLFPATSIANNTEKYVNGKKVAKVFITLSIYLIIAALVGQIVSGCFTTSFSAVKGGNVYKVDFNNLVNLNYIKIIIMSLVFGIGASLYFSIINYATSFLNNKGLTFGSFLLISTLSLSPFILSLGLIYPIVRVFSIFIAFVIALIAFIYSIAVYLISLKNLMEFDSENRLIRYVFISLTIGILIVTLILMIFFKDDINVITSVF